MTWGFKKCTSLQDLSILLQHVAGCLRMLVQCARQNYFLNEKSISSSEILTSYWQLVSKIIPIQWTQVKTQSAYPRRRSNIILNMCSGCWGNKWPVIPMKFPSDSIGNNSKVQIPPWLLSKHADWCVPGDLVHAVNPLKLLSKYSILTSTGAVGRQTKIFLWRERHTFNSNEAVLCWQQ